MESEIALIVEAGLVSLTVVLFVFELFVSLGDNMFKGKPIKGLKKGE